MCFKRFKNMLLMLMTAICLSVGAQSTVIAGTDKQCQTDIQALLDAYQNALNSSDVDKVMPLYAEDGVFMPDNKPTSVGQVQVKAAYKNVFKALDLDVAFHVEDIDRQGDIAFVRTNSDGEIKLLKENALVKNHTRELFIMKRVNDEWKIYQYMFNKVSSSKH